MALQGQFTTETGDVWDTAYLVVDRQRTDKEHKSCSFYVFIYKDSGKNHEPIEKHFTFQGEELYNQYVIGSSNIITSLYEWLKQYSVTTDEVVTESTVDEEGVETPAVYASVQPYTDWETV